MPAALKRRLSTTTDAFNSKRPQTNDYYHDEVVSEASSSSDHGEAVSDGEVDEDEWTGFGAKTKEVLQEHGDAPDRSKKPIVIPSGHEVKVMKEAAELYKSSSFKLKIDSLLPSVRPKYDGSAAANLEFVLRKLHEFLYSISPVQPLHPLEASAHLQKQAIAVPYCQPLPTEDTNWKVSFEQPADIKLVGSWVNRLSVKSKDGEKFCVDVGVEMPNTLFQEKDYLNGRFFHKRAFYIASIAAALKENFPVHLSFQSTFNDPRLTTLVLRSREDKSKNDFSKLNAQIRIIPILRSSSPIPLKHLAPSRCNLRVTASPNDSSTPHYNSALLLCLTPTPHLLANFNLKRDVQSFTDALALLRVWANQRGYGEGSAGWNISGFEGRGMFWSSLLTLLIKGEEPLNGKRRKLNPVGKGLSSYQLFKAALGLLARHDFQKDSVYMKSDSENLYVGEYETHHESVFVDSNINLLHDISTNSLQMLQHDAKVSLDSLDSISESEDPFSDAFLQEKRHLSTRFDVVIQVDLSSAKPKRVSDLDALDFGSPGNLLLSSLASTLRRGLGNRTKAVAILHHSSSPRPLTQALPFTPSVVQIGLILDSENAFRLVDHGPSAEESEADPSFRNFWGEDKAELRRFKDGKIIESVVWDIKTVDDKARIPGIIVTHILTRHFGINESKAVKTWLSSLDNVLRLPPEVSRIYDRVGPEVGFKMAMVAFDALVKRIKSLSDLPLAILNISPVSDHLRYTAVFSPVAIPIASMVSFPPWMRYLPGMDVILEFEKSTKWPDDLGAIQKMKLAFFEQMARSIVETYVGAKACTVLDDTSSSDMEDQARLDIVTPEGWVFSLRIWHDREAALLDRIIDVKPRVPRSSEHHQDNRSVKEKHQAVKAKDVYLRRFIHSPKHHRAVLNLCHRYTAFPGTVRLVKRWFASHWFLGGHVSPEAVELICAKIYLGDGKYLRGDSNEGQDERPGLPITKERGFAQVIKFLMEWKWEEGVAVPIYGSREPINFHGERAVSDMSAWRLLTEEDSTGTMWTRDGPNAVVARRVTSFAKATWEALQRGIHIGNLDAKTIFSHPTIDYDFVIELDAAILPRSHQNISAKTEDYVKVQYVSGASAEIDKIRPGFDPAQLFLEDMKRVYADTIMFFYDPYGGDQIGGIWLPTLRGSRQFKVLGGFSSTPLAKEKGKEKGLVVLNTNGILDEIGRMGNGMVKRISVRQQ